MAEDRAALGGAPDSAAASQPAAVGWVRLPRLLSHPRAVLFSMRPRQWTKNLIVYMALLFSINQEWKPREVDSWAPLLGEATLAFIFFCLISSADYLVNDVRDREVDRLHPRKRFRPIAAGQLPVGAALVWAAVLSAVALAGSFALDWRTGAVVAGYIGLMLAYSFHLKHVVLLDMMAIGAGFVLRAMAGALAIDVPISPWLYVVTALGALFLVINKRRAELILLEADASQHRPILEEYTHDLLDQMASMVTAATVIAYGLYTFTADNLPENHAMMLTIPFVVYGIFRYLYLVHARNEGGSPEDVLLRDWPLIVDILLWLAASGAILVAYRE